ncbi:uncharacterized protein LOC110708830 [Chenopodium quinoa]|uniref:uncharacterized protein LOC110708830 n=1 Tax=Chenopodium quinoa TaxID=63459 RepID=UPI000B78EE31|nr:uncharacterized protein LOC110708830 [Chenopodium quinoa]
MNRMIEKSKEELQMLETNHPYRFDYLKNELKSFITLLESQFLPEPLPTTSSTTTQASTSMKRKRVSLKRRKVENGGWENDYSKIEYNNIKVTSHRDRVDVVLEKAQACLCKIQEYKCSMVFAE